MTYYTNPIAFLRFSDDHFIRIKKAEQIKNHWKVNFILIILTFVIYGWMAYLGMGSNFISGGAIEQNELIYETSKLWFLIGRVLFGILFALIILFIPSLLFYLLTDISFQKLLIMQQIVLAVILVERLLWIPLAIFTGLEWYVSPLSFGIIASYLTETSWIIPFFGAISIFQLWIIWFQAKYLIHLAETKRYIIWMNVILLHIVGWCFAGLISFADTYLINGWFG